jgi:hypothetical protein
VKHEVRDTTLWKLINLHPHFCAGMVWHRGDVADALGVAVEQVTNEQMAEAALLTDAWLASRERWDCYIRRMMIGEPDRAEEVTATNN